MKKYIKDNSKVLKFINNSKYNILQIKPVKKHIKHGLLNYSTIASYCIIYEKMI